MRPFALLVSLAAVFTAGCILPPGDAAQIRALAHDRAAAIARGDLEALYRMHDLDFRAVCSLARFRTLPQEGAPVLAVRDIQIRGVRGSATLDLAPPAARSERREFVKDAGRWYLYEDTQACLRGVGSRESGQVTTDSRLPTPDSRLPRLPLRQAHG